MEEEKRSLVKPVVVGIFLIAGVILAHRGMGLSNYIYVLAYLVIALPVIKEGYHEVRQGDIFNEYTLMFIATIGAFAIGEFPEAVSVMLFYYIGEMFQDRAVDRANDNIKSLVAIRPDKASVVRGDGTMDIISPDDVNIGDEIEVKPGERVPLDGTLLSATASFNTAALTGESVPRHIEKDGEVLAGMISCDSLVHISVTRKSDDSALSRIMHLVQDAAERKAPAELFIRKFARVYTPIVILCSVLTFSLPYAYSLIDSGFHYIFSDWFYRGLIFLVVSCPCAFVISIPLSYYAGIGAASRRGILFKGGNVIDAMLKLRHVVFDKTGTLTRGVFAVKEMNAVLSDLLPVVASVERASNHPIARAILQYASSGAGQAEMLEVENMTEISGFGISAVVKGRQVYVGSLRLLDKYGIVYPESLKSVPETIVACASDGHFAGYLLLADQLKDDAHDAVSKLRAQNIGDIQILSGDKQQLVDSVVSELGVNSGYGDLLPEGKVAHIEQLRSSGAVAFVGDGINDAPVLALSDIGIAMGGAGNDVAVETADVVIQNEQPSRVAEALDISRRTHRVVIQNVTVALGIKITVMVMGVLGVANLWEAVFADVGVTVIAVLNSLRLIRNRESQA
jgi:Cd2+/Zn2+-exporting ATPase